MLTKKILAVLLALVGVAGAGVSVAMLISAVDAMEWGRVVLYAVSLAVFTEMAVMNILKLKPSDSEK